MNTSSTATPQRVMSIDALRGFDMFWIIGGSEILRGALRIFWNPIPAVIEQQLDHPVWGPAVTFWDLVMPLFLFIVGASMPYSFGKRQERGDTRAMLHRKIFTRFVLLILLGMICRDGMAGLLKHLDWDHVRIAGNTLQYIACAYLVSALALLRLSIRGQLALAFALLLAYCLMMLYVSLPGLEAGILTRELNLARVIDSLFLGNLNGFPRAPTILPAMALSASMLLGVMAGHVLRLPVDEWKKVRYLCLAGLGCLVLGWAWSFWFMMIKWLWTSSYALWMAGWSFLLLAGFHVVIDIRGYRRWAFPFVVIGSNAILAYVVSQVYGDALSKPLVAGLAHDMGEAGDFILAAGEFAVLWLILWHLYRQRIFLRV